MDLLRIKSRSRSPGRGNNNNNKRTPTTSPAGIRDNDDNHVQRVASRGDGYAGGASITSKTQSAPPPALDIAAASKENIAPSLQVVEFSFPSLLSPPNPAFVTGSDARGILMNARRPVSSREATITPTAASSSTIPTQSPAKAKGASTTPSALSQSRPQLRTSLSADSISTSRNPTPEQILPNFGGREDDSDNNKFDSVGSRKIRFAPLPDPRRPRRYSTGRDIWMDDDPDNIHLNTRGGLDVRPEDWNTATSPMNISGSRDSMDDGTSSLPSTFGSLGSNQNHKRTTSSTSSITSKFLNPLKLGRSKSKDKDLKRTSSLEAASQNPISPSSYSSVSNWLTGGGEPLGRRISTGTFGDSPASERQRAEEFRSSGIPLRKSNTQESESGAAAPRIRKAYPSVAQGANRRRAQNYVPVVEPVFMEWTNPTAGNNIAGTDDFDDDGSGMAWLKKRRMEREQKAKEEKEAAVSAKVSAAEDTQVPALMVQPDTPTVERGEADELQLEEEDGENEQFEQNEEESENESEDEEDEDDIATAQSDDGEDNDLTAAEIEEEERLAEEARRTTGGAGREVFHSHEHHASTYTVEAPKDKKGGLSSKIATPSVSTDVSRRGSPVPNSYDFPRHVATA